jgi:hypothetical protein
MTAGGPLAPSKTSIKLPSDKEVKKKQKKRKDENEEEEDEEEVASLTKKLTLISIDMESYIEDYVRKNYFKLYKLMPFQMKGITSALTLPSLIDTSSPLTPPLAPSPPPLTPLIGWVVNSINSTTCHRPHCQHLAAKGDAIAIDPPDLAYFRKCSHCHPPIVKYVNKLVSVAI